MAALTSRMATGRVTGSAGIEAGQLLGGQLEVGRGSGVDDRGRSLRARDRDDARRLGELPRQRDLLGAHATLGGDLGERGVLVGELLGVGQAAEWAPGQEGQPELLADV